MLPIAGYTGRWSVAPGENLDFKVSSLSSEPYQAHLLRIICADANPAGPGILEEDLSSIFTGKFSSREQPVRLGSYAKVPVNSGLPACDQFTFMAGVYPTLLEADEQGIISMHDRHSNRISLQFGKDGHLECRHVSQSSGDWVVRHDHAFLTHCWFAVWISVDQVNGVLHIGQQQLNARFGTADATVSKHQYTLDFHVNEVEQIFIATLDQEHGFFNGRIERPQILNEVVTDNVIKDYYHRGRSESTIALWDFSEGIGTQSITDVGNLKLHGQLVNCPTRAVRGSNWSGREMCWRHLPQEYGAIHFHDDDIYDCDWETDFSFQIPDDLPSAMYAMRLENSGGYDDVVFYVRPASGKPTARLCVIIPTFTYTVYINQSRNCTDAEYWQLVRERGARPWNPDQFQQYGLSTYNNHSDGSGICFSSNLRPNLTMKPNFIATGEKFVGSGMRHVPADTHLFAWLEHFGYEFDMVTDHDIHNEGCSILEPYQTVVTATHPEYHSANTLDAIQAYLANGGNLMYLGGNGFYWKVALNDNLPGMIEIRRAEGGIRTWEAEPGEYYNALDGEYGGMWRRNGRPPQQLVGVGFTAQGRFEGTYYRRNPDLNEQYGWIFEGVEGQIIGNFGLCGGGAAGFELDRADQQLGTVENAVVLASSEQHPEHFVLVPEEKLTHLTTRTGESEAQMMRADMIYFDTPAGGAVFSAGSITYCGSLPANEFDNNISRITLNVLHRFLTRSLKP